MNKSAVVLLNSNLISVPAISRMTEDGNEAIVPLVPSDWEETTSLDSQYQSYIGIPVVMPEVQSATEQLINALQAQTEAITQQTLAISHLVNSNLDLVDQLTSSEIEQSESSGYLDEPDTL